MNFPDPNVTTEYESPDGLKYVWNGFAWEIECGGSPQVNLDPYLKKYGHNVDDATGVSSYYWNDGVLFDGNATLTLNAADLIDIKSLYNLNISAVDGDMSIRATDGAIVFRTEKLDLNGPVIIYSDGAYLDSAINLTTVSNDHLIDKGYVDQRDEILHQEIIELEEEIDAIAPSVERGIWKFNLGGVVGSRGQLTMYDGVNGSGSPIGLFTGAKSVWLNELDNDGTPHGFANVIAGDLIELFVQGDADYGLFNVVEVHDETQGAAQYWMIDVEFVRSLSATSKVDNADDVRVKISKPPSGGDAGDFVLKTGDIMTGDLKFAGTPYQQLLFATEDSTPLNNDKGRIFKVEHGGSYSNPLITIGVEPTTPNCAVTRKYVDDSLADQIKKLQDQLDEFKQEVEATYAPVVTAIATKFKDSSSDEPQVLVNYFVNGNAPDGKGFTSVSVVNADKSPDINTMWINVNGVRHEAHMGDTFSNGHYEWSLMHASGDLTGLVGTTVTLHNC